MALFALVLVAALLALTPRLKPLLAMVLGMLVFGWLAWSIYPAWLTEDGTLAGKVLVCAGIAASMSAIAGLAEVACRERQGSVEHSRRFPLALAALIPPMIALAILLQIGGAARLGQAAGALATALGTVCLVVIVSKKTEPGGVYVPALWGLFSSCLPGQDGSSPISAMVWLSRCA